MGRIRFSIAWLMGFVLVAALGVGGLRVPTSLGRAVASRS